MRHAKISLSLFLAAAIGILVGVAHQASAQPSTQQSAVSLSGISGRVLDRIARVCSGGHCSYSNNTNAFDLSRIQQRVSEADCDRQAYVRAHGREPCPGDMAWVCSAQWQVNICVDRDLRPDNQGRARGHVTRAQCETMCAAQGRRLLTNNEFLAACEGTQAHRCLPERGVHPVMARLHSPRPWIYNGIDCKAGNNAWGPCINDPTLNQDVGDLLNLVTPAAGGGARSSCASDYGVRDMVGVLGQWVSDTYHGRGQFNGGLYSQPRSSCNYTTVAHNTEYTDYSIGCRCGAPLGAGR
jgi:formylglycine-generating enzyme required for sulfatase activity